MPGFPTKVVEKSSQNVVVFEDEDDCGSSTASGNEIKQDPPKKSKASS
jgi:hypothetical protein